MAFMHKSKLKNLCILPMPNQYFLYQKARCHLQNYTVRIA